MSVTALADGQGTRRLTLVRTSTPSATLETAATTRAPRSRAAVHALRPRHAGWHTPAVPDVRVAASWRRRAGAAVLVATLGAVLVAALAATVTLSAGR